MRSARDGTWLLVPQGQARRLARRLEAVGDLLYAEPNALLARASAFDSSPDRWARAAVVSPATRWPSGLTKPIAVIDDFVDPGSLDFGRGQVRWLEAEGREIQGGHGTSVASAAAAVFGNDGVFGVLPGAPLLSYQPRTLTCVDVAEGVLAASDAGAGVINISLGTPNDCFTLFRAVSLAFGAGAIIVAASGNEYAEGNPVIYPAAYPHVLSVAAVTVDTKAAYFSSSNAAVDLAAPGVDVPVAVPMAFDDDGRRDGVTLADGTSFAAPMVAGAAAWLRVARPRLSGDQVADLLRHAATDIMPGGWDRDTGFGLVDLDAALVARDPPVDPLEPNDLIGFINGTAFDSPDPYIWRGYGSASYSASVDAVEDPVDIYRVRIPGRAAVRITVRPSSGDPDLEVYSSRARYIGDRSALIARSRKAGTRADAVEIVNSARSTRAAYIAIEPYDEDYLDARYRLAVRRVRR